MFKSILLLLSLYLRTISALTVNTTSSIQLPEIICLPRGPGLVPLRYVQCVAALGLILHEARYQPGRTPHPIPGSYGDGRQGLV